MTVKTELILAFGLIALVLSGIGGVGIYGINQSNADMKAIYEDRTVPAVDLATINDIWENVRKNLDAAVNSQDAATAKAKSDENFQIVKRAEGIWARYALTNMTPDQERLAKTKLELHAAYVDLGNRIFQMVIAGNHEAARKSVKEDAEPIFFRLHDTVYSMITLQGEVAGKVYAQLQKVISRPLLGLL